MKEIKAYLRPTTLEPVIRELEKTGARHHRDPR
jgi:nitrogen regulatory protein PII